MDCMFSNFWIIQISISVPLIWECTKTTSPVRMTLDAVLPDVNLGIWSHDQNIRLIWTTVKHSNPRYHDKGDIQFRWPQWVRLKFPRIFSAANPDRDGVCVRMLSSQHTWQSRGRCWSCWCWGAWPSCTPQALDMVIWIWILKIGENPMTVTLFKPP